MSTVQPELSVKEQKNIERKKRQNDEKKENKKKDC
jgi:hypothetical protein